MPNLLSQKMSRGAEEGSLGVRYLSDSVLVRDSCKPKLQ
jgi:hypothetical protein